MEQLLLFYLQNPYFVSCLDPHSLWCICEYALDPNFIRTALSARELIIFVGHLIHSKAYHIRIGRYGIYKHYSPVDKRLTYYDIPIYNTNSDLQAIFHVEAPDDGKVHFKIHDQVQDAVTYRKSRQLYPHPGDENGKIEELVYKIYELPEFVDQLGTSFNRLSVDLSSSISF